MAALLQQDSNGTTYELSGKTGRPTVVLIHGLGMSHNMWDQHVPALSEYYQMLRYDLSGHGTSALPTQTPNLSVFAGQLRDLLDELAVECAALAGFSLGGMINRRFAMDYPERVQGLAILNAPHERDPEEQMKVEVRAQKSLADGPGTTLDAAIERWFTPGFIRERPDYISQTRALILANDSLNYGHCRSVLATGVRELIRPEPAIPHPALVMTCENDSGSTPAMSRAIAREIIGSEVIIVPRLQHCGLLEQPALFTEPLLKFLDGIFDW